MSHDFIRAQVYQPHFNSTSIALLSGNTAQKKELQNPKKLKYGRLCWVLHHHPPRTSKNIMSFVSDCLRELVCVILSDCCCCSLSGVFEESGHEERLCLFLGVWWPGAAVIFQI